MCPVYNHPREFSMLYRNLIPKLNLALLRIVYSNNDKNEYRVMIGKIEMDLFKTSFKEVYADLRVILFFSLFWISLDQKKYYITTI